jgi:hypothetical protein
VDYILSSLNSIPADKSSPLSDECLEIVQKATPIDIAYVDVRGSRDENGKYGYVHDETALRLHPEKFDVKEKDLREMCLKRDDNYKMLHEKVFVDLEHNEHVQSSKKRRPKIMCIVFNTLDKFDGNIPPKDRSAYL